MDLLAQVSQSLRNAAGPHFERHRYLIAVSGGIDSMVLWDLMTALIPPAQLSVAHFNHRLRGNASTLDERLVARRAKALGNRLFLGSRESAETSEAALRRERWRFLESARHAEGADYILTAHHANDQLETLFMRLLRGSGIDGLAAMAPQRGKRLKPLLYIPKSALKRHAREKAIRFREDASNHQDTYFRNRVRRQLIPAWRDLAGEHGGETRSLARLMETTDELRWARRYLNTVTRRRYRRIVVETPFWIRAPLTGFASLEPPWQERLLRRIWRQLRAPTLDRPALRRLREHIVSGTRAITPGGGVWVRQSCGHLFFTSPEHRRNLKSAQLPQALGNPVLEPEAPSGHELRCFRAGDRLGSRKLKKLLLERRIPEPERALIPVVAKCGTQEIAWIFPEKNGGITLRGITFPFTFFD